jgi:hypothetical protein
MAGAKPASSCAATLGDPKSQARGQSRVRGRTDRTRSPGRERRERPSKQAEQSWYELEVSGGRPRLSRAAFSNSARWALRSQKGRGTLFLTLGDPGPRRRPWPQSWGCKLRWGSSVSYAPSARPCTWGLLSVLEPSQLALFRSRNVLCLAIYLV